MPAKLQLLAPDEQMLNPAYSAEAFDNYDPSFSQINEARYSQFYITDDVVLAGMSAADRSESLTEEQFKASEDYREGITYQPGMTRGALAIQARRHDANQYDNYVLERAKGAKNVAASIAGFTEATVLDPINLVASLLPVPGLREVSALKSMALQGAFGAAKAGVIKGAVQGAVGSLYFEPLLYGAAQEFGEEYTFANTIQNVLTNALFGGAIHGAGSGLKAKFTAKEIPVEQAKEAISKTTFEMHHDLIPDNEIILKQGEIIKQERVVAAEVRNLEEQMAILEKQHDTIATPEQQVQIKQQMDALADERIAEITDYRLPKDLSGAKPRYNYGSKSYDKMNFESDVDKALFIVSQKTKSKRDADYRAFLKDKVGMSDAEIQSRGMLLRDNIKSLAKEGAGGTIDVPKSRASVAANDEIKLGVQEKLKSKQEELRQINERKQEIAARQREIESQPAEKVMERDYVLGDLYNKVPDEPQPDFDVAKKTEEARAVIDSMAGSEYIPPETKQRLAEEFTQLNTEQVSLSKAIEMAAFCFLKGGK